MVTHDVVVRGATFAGGPSPVILQRSDDDFIANILRDAVTDSGRDAIAATVAAPPAGSRSGRLKLFQPVHQTFHVALLEVVCQEVGHPRLDPRSIDSMGIVIRRVLPAAGGRPDAREAWLQAGRKLRTWQELPGDLEDADPDSERRPAMKAGHPEIDRRLALLRMAAGSEALTEAVAPLFLAPPEVCKAANRTLLYGLLPLASAERSEAPSESAYTADIVNRRMATYFKAATHTRAVPRANQTIGISGADDAALQDYISMLAQLTFEFDAFSDSATGRAMMAALDAIRLPFSEARAGNIVEVTRPAGTELQRAAALLVQRQPGTILMPLRWPEVTTQQAQAITTAATNSARSRFAAARQSGFVTGPTRYEDPAAIYRLRAFVRIKRPDGCPPRLQWSEYSQPFRIAAWYDNNPASPPVQVVIPEIRDMSRVKPNVAFKVPEAIFNVLERNKKLEGLGRPGVPEIGLGWICAFNIPIITLCAFIVLNIFLQLFNIIFSWLFFVKICIPIPKVSTAPPED